MNAYKISEREKSFAMSAKNPAYAKPYSVVVAWEDSTPEITVDHVMARTPEAAVEAALRIRAENGETVSGALDAVVFKGHHYDRFGVFSIDDILERLARQ